MRLFICFHSLLLVSFNLYSFPCALLNFHSLSTLSLCTDDGMIPLESLVTEYDLELKKVN